MNDQISIIFEKIGFSAINFLVNSKEQKHCVAFGKIGNQDVLIKIFHTSNIEKSKNLKDEWLACKIIERLNSEGVSNFRAIESLNFGQEGEYVYLVRKYYQGNPFASDANRVNSDFYFDKYSSIDKKFEIPTEDISVGIISNLLILKKTKGINPADFDFRQQGRFPRNYSSEVINDIAKFLGIDLQPVADYLLDSQNLINDNKNFAVQTNDLTPTNIFITKNHEVLFSDFEWMGLENYMIDITFLWMLLWRYPDWQKIIVDHTVSSDIERDLFRANLVRIVLYNYRDFCLVKKLDDDEERVSFNKRVFGNHIWTKYLLAAGQSFEAIMEVKQTEENGQN